jgi:Na+-driven multidrug efflux pump
LLVFIFCEQLMRIFSADPAVIASGVSALRALSFALPFWAIWFVSSGSFRGSGDTRTPLIVGASTMWLSVLLAFIGVRWFGAGLGWVWLAFVLTSAPASLLMWWIFRRRVSNYESGRRALPPPVPSFSH